MSYLLRIIMINGHLQGVIELDLDGHTNICGTNASGKTTLQRLIPVFYGERPNTVVPKTRKKFDQFYLPNSNSYLIYEYRRETGNTCHVAITRKKDDGVSYRFINAAYSPELYFNDERKAYSYAEFTAGLRQRGIDSSHRIDTISEYRSIIQNDFSLLTGSLPRVESTRIRQTALRYSLVESPHRLRHIEKLVSAVHAKEGKMDTLKTMLAAIFEDEGVALPTTQIKGAQVREWVQRVRQSRRLSSLNQDVTGISTQVDTLNTLEQTLWQLQPLLLEDASQLERQCADQEAEIKQAQRALDLKEQQYESQRQTQNDKHSQVSSQLAQVETDLNDIELRYEQFTQADMQGLENDVNQLPEWRAKREELATHLQLMREVEGGSRQRFESRKLELSEQLNAFVEKMGQQQHKLRNSEQELRAQQTQEQRQLEQEDRQKQQLLNEDYQAKHTTLIEQQADSKARLNAPLMTVEEQQNLDEKQARIDDVQLQLSAQADDIERLHAACEQSKAQQHQHLDAISAQRKTLRLAQQRYAQLKLQREPKPGSLRHFLQQQIPDWQHSVGKVIRDDLLERTDLAPTLMESVAESAQLDSSTQQQLFNMQLDLAAIELPVYAQDEQALLTAIEKALSDISHLEQHLAALENEQKGLNSNAQQQQALWYKARQKRDITLTDLNFASDARQRLVEEYQQLQQQRKVSLQEQQQQLEKQLETLKSQHKTAEHEHDSAFKTMLLEYQAYWQQALNVLREQIVQLDKNTQAKRQETEQQVHELQVALEHELREQGIDPEKLKEIELRLKTIRQQVNVTEERRDELDAYRQFMRVDWQQRKPDLLGQERLLKQQKTELAGQLAEHKAQFLEQKKSATSAIKVSEVKLDQQRKQREQIVPLLKQLEQFPKPSTTLELTQSTGDCAERIERARSALQEKQQLDLQLKNTMQVFERELLKDAAQDFLDMWGHQQQAMGLTPSPQQSLAAYQQMLRILQDLQLSLLAQGSNYGADLSTFFDVFSDLNRRISAQSRRLSEEVTEEFVLEGISKSEVRIHSSIDELGFWKPLKRFAKLYQEWEQDAEQLPSDAYLDALNAVAELLRNDQQFSFESLLRLELHLNEGGSDLIIRNDRQLLEASSHGMAYLILCKYLLAFTRLLRDKAQVTIHWPIDEIGTLAYHNVEKLFKACENNNIFIVGAFPNPESDVLTLFKNRYLIEKDNKKNSHSQLKRIEPQLSRLSQRLLQHRQEIGQ
ncbi:MAG: ATP-binding protein [Pseudomonas sp.]|nr:ATP-binding protein [Pseudomonas sp.]